MFVTDFGTANDAVAICRAVIVGIVPEVRIMDITHQVTPFSIEEGARFLADVTPYYPAGTVFLGVVEWDRSNPENTQKNKTLACQYRRQAHLCEIFA